MSNENPGPHGPDRRRETQPDHAVELNARFTIPAAFAVGDVSLLAASLIEHVADAEQATWDDFGPYALGDPYGGAYVTDVRALCRVVGRRNRGPSHQRNVTWGHGDRCQCYHPVVDHECPEDIAGAAGRCFVDGCGCGPYARLSPEA